MLLLSFRYFTPHSELNQKYSYVVYTGAKKQHEVEVSHIDGRQWKSIFYKKSEN